MSRPMPELTAINKDPIFRRLIDEQFSWTNPITREAFAVNGIEAGRMIIASQGKNKDRLRAAKPPMDESIVERVMHGHKGLYRTSPLNHCAAAQVWRLVAFHASPLGQHHCMPVGVDFDCPFDMDMDDMRRFTSWCANVANIILEVIPLEKQYGFGRWAKALTGMQITDEVI